MSKTDDLSQSDSTRSVFARRAYGFGGTGARCFRRHHRLYQRHLPVWSARWHPLGRIADHAEASVTFLAAPPIGFLDDVGSRHGRNSFHADRPKPRPLCFGRFRCHCVSVYQIGVVASSVTLGLWRLGLVLGFGFLSLPARFFRLSDGAIFAGWWRFARGFCPVFQAALCCSCWVFIPR